MGNLRISPGKENCVCRISDKKIKFSGKETSTLFLSNPLELPVEKVKVDGCVITEGRRCDWAVELPGPKTTEEIFIELKRSHIGDAAKQLAATVEKISSDSNRIKKRCMIVFVRCPLPVNEIKEMKKEFQRKYNARLELVRSLSTQQL
jgi:hypothetical protein